MHLLGQKLAPQHESDRKPIDVSSYFCQFVMTLILAFSVTALTADGYTRLRRAHVYDVSGRHGCTGLAEVFHFC
jgi:hypothetical protein